MKGGDDVKIDFDLIREILLKVEESENPVNSQTFINEKYSEDLVNYHVSFLENEKFIVVKKEQYVTSPKPFYIIKGITLEGYKYLKEIKHDKISDKIKDIVENSKVTLSVAGQSVTFDKPPQTDLKNLSN